MTLPDFDALKSIAKEAGELAMAGWTLGKAADDVWEKVPGHIVCSVDLAVNDLLKSKLEELYPEAGWLSEETAADKDRLSRKAVWVVDPIDGTKDYVKGRAGWAISIALVQGGAPVMAVLEAPAMQESWAAIAGHGSHVNGRKLTASQRADYDGARIPADFLPDTTKLVKVDKPNSIALRMAMVADDRADLVASVRWGHEWDIAAADLIVTGAGGVVTDALGQELRYNGTHGKALGVLCCAPDIQDAAVKTLAKISGEVLKQGQ